MNEAEFDQRIKAKAYRLFIAELEQHLDSARKMFGDSRVPSPEDFKRVGNAFHQIRGGAGFFGLNDFAGMAHQVEAKILHDTAQASAKVDDVRRLLEKLSTAAKNLPKPVEAEKQGA
jgi:chemotaxis protein histidine kinase CheA